jgi:hypothetical protein
LHEDERHLAGSMTVAIRFDVAAQMDAIHEASPATAFAVADILHGNPLLVVGYWLLVIGYS